MNMKIYYLLILNTCRQRTGIKFISSQLSQCADHYFTLETILIDFRPC